MPANGETSKFPPVVLNTTLADLLKAEDPSGSLETFCCIKPNSDRQYGTAVPLSDKYIIHSAQVDTGDDLAHLQLEICSYLLMFFAGKMNVMLLACEGETEDKTLDKETVDRNAKHSFGVIQESQRPIVKTYANIEDAVLNNDGSKIRWAFAMDFAERLPYLLHPEVVYLLNSKRWLAVTESLRSANDRVLDCDIRCATHRQEDTEGQSQWFYGGKTCHECTAGVEAEIQRIRAKLQRREPPYVLKLTQSLSSVGTLMVKDEDDKKEVIDQITEYLAKYLPRITKYNVHLKTTSLILSDFIPGKTMALNFFVRKDGSAEFLGACHQLSTGESGRQTTAITYADQDKLEPRYRKVLAKIGQALAAEGYYGPVGADVMEEEDGNLFTIDLNVRTPLSLVLYLLREHFQKNRGFGTALVYECVMLKVSRDEFEKQFEKEFQDGRIVLLGSTRMGSKEVWAFGMVLAGEDKGALDELSERILKNEA